jgi:hypothetical protein
MVRLLIEDVTLTRQEQVLVQVRFKGGTCRELVIPRPLLLAELTKTDAQVIAEIDRLLDEHDENEIAKLLTQQGLRTLSGAAYRPDQVRYLRRVYKLPDRFARLRARGLMTVLEVALRYEVTVETVRRWKKAGLVQAHHYTGKDYLLEPPSDDGPGQLLSRGCREDGGIWPAAPRPAVQVAEAEPDILRPSWSPAKSRRNDLVEKEGHQGHASTN